MKKLYFISCTFLLLTFDCYSQLKINSSYSNNGKGNVHGVGVNIGYEFRLYKKISTTTQIGYKNLSATNDFIDGNLRNKILEFHQTFSYLVINKKKYKFTPNVGLNLRFFDWDASINPPYNATPIRSLFIEFRDRFLIISSADNRFEDAYKVANVGFTLQLENQIYLSKNLTLLITPFIEDDYDGIQTVAGCYLGVKIGL